MTTPPGGPGGHGYAGNPQGQPGGGGFDPRYGSAYPAPAPGPAQPYQQPAGPAAHQPYRQPYGYPDPQAPWQPDRKQPARPDPRAAAGHGFGPAPRRSRIGLLAQFVLQFVYIPVWVLLAVGVLVLAIWADSAGNANVGPSEGMFRFSTAAISWRRLRAEWSGRAESWAPFTDSLLAESFAKAEKSSGWEPAKLPPDGVRRAVCDLPVRHYRGLDSAAMEQLAGRRGWSVDRENAKDPADRLPFVRLIPPPPLTGVPDPYGPPPAPGAPWGPLPRRPAVPLSTFVFLPRLRSLELRGSQDAYLAHLREHLPALFRTELARDPGKGYLADGEGRILRRVSVRSWHHRGIGAHAVLRVAAEQGWRIDPSYPARPDGTVHLCHVDTRTP